MSHPPRPCPVPISNSSVIVCSRLCFTQNMIICNLILSFVEVERLCFTQNMIICNLILSFVEVEHIAILLDLVIVSLEY